ncbi:MAG: DsbA family oxidoreductase [Fusobacteriaceae bacterium]
MKIGIIIDFVCPYCFVDTEIMWKALGKKVEEMEITWYPYELTPEPSQQKRVDTAREKYFKENIEPWAEKEGVKINFPTIDPIPRTALAFEGIKIAKKYGLESQFVKNVFESYWIRNKNIGDMDVLSDVAEKIGVPKNEFRNSLQSGEFKEQHKEENSKVSDWDFDVVPTFYVDGEKIPQFPKTLEEMKNIFL